MNLSFAQCFCRSSWVLEICPSRTWSKANLEWVLTTAIANRQWSQHWDNQWKSQQHLWIINHRSISSQIAVLTDIWFLCPAYLPIFWRGLTTKMHKILGITMNIAAIYLINDDIPLFNQLIYTLRGNITFNVVLQLQILYIRIPQKMYIRWF